MPSLCAYQTTHAPMAQANHGNDHGPVPPFMLLRKLIHYTMWTWLMHRLMNLISVRTVHQIHSKLAGKCFPWLLLECESCLLQDSCSVMLEPFGLAPFSSEILIGTPRLNQFFRRAKLVFPKSCDTIFAIQTIYST